LLVLPHPKKIEQPRAHEEPCMAPTPVAHLNGAFKELTYKSQPEPTA
jgi:hypothetical protein